MQCCHAVVGDSGSEKCIYCLLGFKVQSSHVIERRSNSLLLGPKLYNLLIGCSLLDGTKSFPINHGKTTKDTFLQASAAVK